ncbi:MAG: TetR/AcrR family transcriptional regulator [Roseiarcus sp.]
MPRSAATEPVEARILEIARAHLRRFGPARTTVVGIAREAGMTHANVYRYFPSKDGLLAEITASWLRPLEARLREAADGADPGYDKLERMLLAIHRVYRQKLETDPVLFDLLIAALDRGEAGVRKHRARVQSEIQRVVEEGITRSPCASTPRRPPPRWRRGSSGSSPWSCARCGRGGFEERAGAGGRPAAVGHFGPSPSPPPAARELRRRLRAAAPTRRPTSRSLIGGFAVRGRAEL